MILNLDNVKDMFLTGQIPDQNDFTFLVNQMKKHIIFLENELYEEEYKSIKDYHLAVEELNTSGFHFSHVQRLMDETLKNKDEKTDIDSFFLEEIKKDDFFDLNKTNETPVDVSNLGSIDQMLMGMFETKSKVQSFGGTKTPEYSFFVFENSLLKEYVYTGNHLSSLITLSTGYKRLNTIVSIDDRDFRLVYSEYTLNDKIGLNIYELEKDGTIKNCNNNKVFSVLYYLNVKGHPFLRKVSPKKEGTDFINSSVYDLNTGNKISNSLSSICAVKALANQFSEPHLKSFDFFIDENDIDKISTYQTSLQNERGSFLLSGNKGTKKSGMITNKSVVRLMPPSFFGLTYFTTLEIERILKNVKIKLNIEDFDYIDLTNPLDINKTINGYFMGLDYSDMLEAYDYTIDPFFGRYIHENLIGLVIDNKIETRDDFNNYKTKSLSDNELELLNNYSLDFTNVKTSLEYSIDEITFINERNNNKDNLLCKIIITDIDNKCLNDMRLLNINDVNLSKALELLEAFKYQNEYYIVDLRKFNKDIIRKTLNNVMTEVDITEHGINKDDFDVSECGLGIEEIKEEEIKPEIIKQIKQKIEGNKIHLLRVTVSNLKYLKKYDKTEDFVSIRLLNTFKNLFENEKPFILSKINEKGFNSYDLFFDDKSVLLFKNMIKNFKNIEIEKIAKLK